jgi:hypothetical protein
MAAIVDYATLTSEIGSHMKRTYTSAETDGFIGLAEGEFRLYLGPNFAKQTSSTPTFTSGSATLPSGFVRPLAVSHSTYGLLDEADIGTIREARVNSAAIPSKFAITGSTIVLDDDSYSGTDITLDYEGTLTGLSGSNTTNWLVLNAPQAYLKMCLSYANARLKSLDQASALRAAALQDLADLGIQSTVAQLSRAAVRIPGSTP